MGEFVLALLIAGIAAAAEGKSMLMGGQRNLKAAYLTVTALGLALTFAAAMGVADRIADTVASLLGEVLQR